MNTHPPIEGRLLVTEDDPILMRFYQYALKGVCTEVRVMDDPDKALEELLEASFDFIITDLKLGGKNGLDIISKAVLKNPDVRVLVASGYVGDSKYREELECYPQIKGFLQKPFTVDELLRTVRGALCQCKSASDQSFPE